MLLLHLQFIVFVSAEVRVIYTTLTEHFIRNTHKPAYWCDHLIRQSLGRSEIIWTCVCILRFLMFYERKILAWAILNVG